MAEKLEKQDKRESLIQVLEIIYRQPGNNSEELALRLKELYLATGRPEAAYLMYENITSARYLTYQFYRDKGELELQIGYDIAALTTLMHAMVLRPNNDKLRLECLELAGRLGSMEAMQELSRPLFNGSLQQKRLPLYQSYYNGLRLSGQFTAADVVAGQILDQSWLSISTRKALLLDRARDLMTMERLYQAERILRTQLVEGRDKDPAIFADLIEDALLAGAGEDGKTLFNYYTEKSENSGWKTSYGEDGRAFFLSYVHLLVKEGRSAAAQTELENYLTGYRKKAAVHPSDTDEELLRLELELCRLYLKIGNKKSCLDLVRRYEKNGNPPAEMRLVKYIAAGNGTVNPEALITNLPGRENHKGGVTELLRLAEASKILGKEAAAISFLQEAQRLYPASMRSRVALAILLKNAGKFGLAADAFYELHQKNPEESWFYVQYLQVKSKQGHNKAVLAELSNQPFATLPFELKLLQARALYATNQKADSFEIYESLLHPSVRSKYRDEMSTKGVRVAWQEQEEQTFWKMFGYDEPDWFDKLNQLQGDEGFLAQSRTLEGSTAARLYDSYRWERLVGSEFLARKALEENKYTVAETQYRKNAEQGQSTESLKDLAKIYERLGEYGKQAEVYSSLEKRGESAPELQESIERNKVALAPTLGLNYEYLEKSGRENLINLQKMSAGVSFQYLPSLNSSLQFGYSELFFEPAEGGGQSVDGRLFSVSSRYKFNERTSIELDSGLQILDSDSDSSVTFSARLNRKFDPLLSGYLEVNQELIDDTVEAVDTGFTTNSIIGGLVLEGTKGFTIGGELERLWYEDNNTQNRLFFFGSYSIFDDLTTYEMKYSYEILTNRDDDTAVVADGGPTVETVLPYWSPDEYWQHLFSIKVQHLLNNPEEIERPPSSYSFDLSVGYESELDFTIGGGANIFLEIGSNFLVKGRLFYTESDDYREESAAVSLMYRW
ncbi:tetratricopeptide repeat protein [Desulfopila aestuarii]|nr:hypothetical protein [Desulfopila aestuarii]